MKKRLFTAFICTALFSVATLTASNPEKCAFTKYMDYKKSRNAALSQQIEKDESILQNQLSNASVSRISNSVFTIPVVVHVIYKTNSQNISDAQIQSQIDVLNEDFSRTNADTTSTPSAFTSIASSTNFQFCLAKQDPDGQPTNGINRRQTTANSFQPNDDMKFYASGGLDAWDVSRYLNIWVCNLSGGVLGFGELPSSIHSNTYGVVIGYNSFGKIGSASPPYNLGRTCTHEISHCFRLYHIWGDDGGGCTGSDYVNDTPNQGDATYGCLNFPATDNCSTSSPGIMFTNYMDYSDDDCLNMFTNNQASRMFTAVNSYYPTLLTSTACNLPLSVEKTPADFSFSIYPNPTSGSFNLDMFTTTDIGKEVNVRVTDVLGKVISENKIENPSGSIHPIQFNPAPSGMYFVTVYNDNYKRTERLTVTR